MFPSTAPPAKPWGGVSVELWKAGLLSAILTKIEKKDYSNTNKAFSRETWTNDVYARRMSNESV